MTPKKPFRKVWIFFLFVTIPSILLLLFLHIHSLNSIRRNHDSLLESNASTIVSSVERSVSEITEDSYNCLTNMDFVVFCSSSTPEKLTRYSGKLGTRLRSALSSYPEVVGYSLYNSLVDKVYNASFSNDFSQILSSVAYDESDYSISTTRKYQVLTVNGSPLIALLYQKQSGSCVILIDPSKNEFYQSYISSNRDDGMTFMQTAATGTTLGKLSVPFSEIPITLRITPATDSGFSSYFSDPTQILILLLIFVLVAAVLVIARAMDLQLIKPLRKLWHSFEHISQGETDYRISEKSEMPEINDFYEGFNQTLDKLETTRSERDQHQLDAVHARLQYFQIQIRPHFYLNCLKNIRAMASIHDDDSIQEIVILMSDYLRYIFQDNRYFIPLSEELEASSEYVDLCAKMGGQYSLEVDIDSDGLDDPTLPMTILTFIENSIKHNQRTDTMTIRLRSRIELSDEGEAFHVVTIQDNGCGFSEEALKQLNDSPTPPVLEYKKNQIGIANVRYRLWIVYGSAATLSFTNEDEFATVTIKYPVKADSEALENAWKIE